MIYESRPNVTADAGGLCLKAGNAVILRGGSESYNSSQAILAAMQDGLTQANLTTEAIQMVPTIDRAAVGEMLTMSKYIDVIVLGAVKIWWNGCRRRPLYPCSLTSRVFVIPM